VVHEAREPHDTLPEWDSVSDLTTSFAKVQTPPISLLYCKTSGVTSLGMSPFSSKSDQDWLCIIHIEDNFPFRRPSM
jgi:hypothetical protein